MAHTHLLGEDSMLHTPEHAAGGLAGVPLRGVGARPSALEVHSQAPPRGARTGEAPLQP